MAVENNQDITNKTGITFERLAASDLILFSPTHEDLRFFLSEVEGIYLISTGPPDSPKVRFDYPLLIKSRRIDLSPYE